MNGRERVLASLRRESPDRVPVYMWFHPSTARHFSTLLEIPVERLGEIMCDDIRQTWVNNNYAMEGIVHENEGDAHVDWWGIRWEKGGDFNQITDFPLGNATPDAISDYAFPTEREEDLLGLMEPVVANCGDCFLGIDVSPCVFEMYWRLRGMEAGMLDLAAQPDVAEGLLARCADFAVSLAEKGCERFPVDWLWTGDDVAGQHALFMSPEMWRELIKPHLQRVIDVGKAHNLPVAHHCCGALHPIIGDLIEMGVEILNPIQCGCPGMDALELKREFGTELAFMGGVDTQYLLVNGSADEVRKETARLIEGMMADGGGYILAASHTIPPETPDENIFAMYSEAGISREEIFDRAAAVRRETVQESAP
jgi:uroporphyrinogen decarboxylase